MAKRNKNKSGQNNLRFIDLTQNEKVYSFIKDKVNPEELKIDRGVNPDWESKLMQAEEMAGQGFKSTRGRKRPGLTVLFGSRTGNGEEIAQFAYNMALIRGFKPELKDMRHYEPKHIEKEKNVLIIVSTHGEGVPPVEAEDLYNFLHNGHQPDLRNLNFTVCALGDSAYQKFCLTGQQFDSVLEKLGGKRVLSRADCDVDYTDLSEKWVMDALGSFSSFLNPTPIKKKSNKAVLPLKDKQSIGKVNPFQSTLFSKVKLNSGNSEKETYHFEFSLNGSGLTFEPGDALGVYAINNIALVNQIINFSNFDPYAKIETHDGVQTLADALVSHYELTILGAEVIKKYLSLSPNKKLHDIYSNENRLKEYMYGRDILDLITDFPVIGMTPHEFTGVLRKLPARLYSIASSQMMHPDSAHLIVAAVRYNINHRERYGVCSTFLADKAGPELKIPVYIESNKNFRLPADPKVPVIMVGPGTGVAPFRAFVQHRAMTGGTMNWLFFGSRFAKTDFFYKEEWEGYLKTGALQHLNAAFSRDGDEKKYVQHHMKAHGSDLYKWIMDGAYFYVCGDAKTMWVDVNRTIIEIISEHGPMSMEKAQEYVKNMQKERRYQIDVY